MAVTEKRKKVDEEMRQNLAKAMGSELFSCCLFSLQKTKKAAAFGCGLQCGSCRIILP